jgi:GNAT superfamily N-acetyltransferase
MPGQMTLADGAHLRVRPIVPADREPLAHAFDRLSDRSRRQRFLAPKPRLSARELDYLTDVDHVTHEALVAIDETSGEIVGVGRYATGSGGGAAADMALAVVDAWQRRGIGHALAVRIVERARANGITRLTGSALADNLRVRSLLDRLGFRVRSVSAGVVEVELEVPPPRGRRAHRARATAGRPGRRAARRASSGRAWRTRASGDPRPCAW